MLVAPRRPRHTRDSCQPNKKQSETSHTVTSACRFISLSGCVMGEYPESHLEEGRRIWVAALQRVRPSAGRRRETTAAALPPFSAVSLSERVHANCSTPPRHRRPHEHHVARNKLPCQYFGYRRSLSGVRPGASTGTPTLMLAPSTKPSTTPKPYAKPVWWGDWSPAR